MFAPKNASTLQGAQFFGPSLFFSHRTLNGLTGSFVTQIDSGGFSGIKGQQRTAKLKFEAMLLLDMVTSARTC